MFANRISKESNGWIKLYKKVFFNPTVTKDSETFEIWIYLLVIAAHPGYSAIFNGRQTVIPEGSVLTSGDSISRELGISKSKVNRTLIRFENEMQIERITSTQKSLIVITNWSKYQSTGGTQNETQSKHERNTDETQSEHGRNTYINKNNKELNRYIRTSSEHTREDEIEKGKFEIPTEEDVVNYAETIESKTYPHEFWSYYNLNQWISGGNPIKDWRALFRQWKPRPKHEEQQPNHQGSFDTNDFFEAAVRCSLGEDYFK